MKQALLALMRSAATRRLILISLIPLMLIFSVFVGIYLHKHKPAPYKVFAAVTRQKLAFVMERRVSVAELAKYYAFDSRTIPLNRTIDTGLMPIRVEGVRLSERFPVARYGGAIAAVGEAVIIMDRLGDLYLRSPDNGGIRKLSVPPLPNDVTRFLAAGNQLGDAQLRSHDMEYLERLRLLAVSHEAFDPAENATRMVVSVIPLDIDENKSTGEWKRLFTGDLEPLGSNVESGGVLAVDDEGNLLLAIGHYELGEGSRKFDYNKFGRIIKISPATGETRPVSIGHRNPQGLIVAKGGRIFSTEHGPRGGDELNMIVEGAHYGWPDVTLGTTYEYFDWGREKVGRHDGYQAPLFAWLPSIGVSGLIQIKGFHERWDGDLLVGSLKGQSLFRIRLEGDRVLYVEPIFIGQRIRSITQLSSGAILLWTDDSQLLSIVPQKDLPQQNMRQTAALSLKLHDGTCMNCHHLGPTSPADMAPTLSGLFKRQIASDNYRYTPALRDKKGPWTEASLREFLLDPATYASGTSMPRPLVKPEDIDEIIQILKEISDTSH